MSGQRVPAKAPGLHIERRGDELLVYNPTNDTAHALARVTAAVFEACNGERSSDDAAIAVSHWVDDEIEIDLVDRTIIDLTDANLLVDDKRETAVHLD